MNHLRWYLVYKILMLALRIAPRDKNRQSLCRHMTPWLEERDRARARMKELSHSSDGDGT